VYEENFEKSSSSLSLGRILLFPSLDFFFSSKKKEKEKRKREIPHSFKQFNFSFKVSFNSLPKRKLI
jgi:hypothetical protein